MKTLLSYLAAVSLAATATQAQVLLNDSWTDGDLTKGSSLEGSWHYTSASSAIEVGPGYMGLVTGSSGRGIHGAFNSGSLNVGDTLSASFTFNTPATVGVDKGEGFRVGLFNSNGTNMAQNHTYSSGSPNAALDVPLGYWLGIDVGSASNDFNFRERTSPAVSGETDSGRLLATSNPGSGFVSLDSGITGSYDILANSTYTGVFSITRTGEDSVQLSVELFNDLDVSLASLSTSGSSSIITTFDTIAFVANSNVFGSSSSVGALDNGIDFTNITIQIVAIPEPSTYAALAGLLVLGLALVRRRKAAISI